jgi:hypothetical protein
MADVIIKPAAGGNLVLQEDGGAAAVTIDTSGDVQLAGSMTAGTLGSAVIVPQATTKKIHRFVFQRRIFASTAAQEYFSWGHFTPLDPVNNSFWLEGFMPCRAAGQDFSGFGIRFTKHGGGSDIDYFNKGHWYTDPNSPTSAMTMHHFTFNTHTAGQAGAGTNQFTWTSSFVPLDPVNNSFWVVGICTGHSQSNDACGYGLRFAKSGGSNYDFDGKGVMYFDAVGTSQTFQNYFFHIAAGTLAAGTYTIYHRCYGTDSQMSYYTPNSSSPRARLSPQVQAELMIREFKNP